LKIDRAVVLLLVCLAAACSDWEVVNYEIPNGYVGPVKINYGQKTCRAERSSILSDIVAVARDGYGCSPRVKAPSGSWEHFYYVDEGGGRVRELRSTGWGRGGEIWGEAGSSEHESRIFFVGTEQQFKAAKTWPPPLGAVGK
jgi:hypothetical protein